MLSPFSKDPPTLLTVRLENVLYTVSEVLNGLPAVLPVQSMVILLMVLLDMSRIFKPNVPPELLCRLSPFTLALACRCSATAPQLPMNLASILLNVLLYP